MCVCGEYMCVCEVSVDGNVFLVFVGAKSQAESGDAGTMTKFLFKSHGNRREMAAKKRESRCRLS